MDAPRSTLLKVNQFAEELNISKHTARQWVARRQIEVVRLGRAIRIPTSEVARLVAGGLRPARRG